MLPVCLNRRLNRRLNGALPVLTTSHIAAGSPVCSCRGATGGGRESEKKNSKESILCFLVGEEIFRKVFFSMRHGASDSLFEGSPEERKKKIATLINCEPCSQ